jgi:hypothetical protein
MKIRFMYSVSRGGVQLHDREAILEVDGGSGQHGTPTPSQLLEAKRAFRSRFDDPRQYLMSYVAGPADGSKGRFSEYRAYLPAT